MQNNPTVAVGICTYKRAESLSRLLRSLQETIASARRPVEIIIVDNDGSDSSLRTKIFTIAEELGLEVDYSIEATPGISAARNAILDRASELGIDLLAMIDDDEWASRSWLSALLREKQESGAIVVGGPVSPVFPPSNQALKKYSRFWSVEKQFVGGKPFVFCTCNFLIDLPAIKHLERPLFEEKFGLSGGGDTAFFRRLFLAGFKMAWADKALVHEEVPPARASLKWMMQRKYRVGNHAVRWEQVGGSPIKVLLKSVCLAIRLPIYPLLRREPEAPLFGWLVEFEKVRGRFSAHFGSVFFEYKRETNKSPPCRI